MGVGGCNGGAELGAGDLKGPSLLLVSSMERGAGVQGGPHRGQYPWHRALGVPGRTHQVGSLSHKLLGRLLPDGWHCDHPPDGIVLWQRWALVLEFLKDEGYGSSPGPTGEPLRGGDPPPLSHTHTALFFTLST